MDFDIIVEKKKNKNAYIKVKEGKVYIIVPTYYTSSMVDKLVKENEKSILRMLKKDSEKLTGFWYLGRPYDKIITPLYDVLFTETRVYIKDEKTLDKYILREALKLYQERLDYWVSVIDENIPTPILRVRKMKSRWGVCNRKNNHVTLNLELMKYDISKLDYVIIHELCHFTYFNHSTNFWTLVSKYCKDYKKIRKELK